MKNIKKTTGLTKKEINTINYKSTMAFDKYHRMFCGCASSLTDYKNTVIYLRIENSERKFPSDEETALKFVNMWKKYNKHIMTGATAYVVKYYHTKSTGFAVSVKDLKKNSDALDTMIEQLKASSKHKKVLFATYSGLLI